MSLLDSSVCKFMQGTRTSLMHMYTTLSICGSQSFYLSAYVYIPSFYHIVHQTEAPG